MKYFVITIFEKINRRNLTMKAKLFYALFNFRLKEFSLLRNIFYIIASFSY